MSRIENLALVLAFFPLASCSGSSENPLIDGMTPELEARVIEKTIEQIAFAENFTHDSFEQIQRKHFDVMVEEMRDAALQNLETRLNKILILEMSQTVELDRESAFVESRVVDPEHLVAIVTLTGTRTYRTNNATKSSETRFSLAWAIGVDGGELVFRHRGIRMRSVRMEPNATVDPALTEASDPPDTANE